jgi:single-strand DNA-binding protein
MMKVLVIGNLGADAERKETNGRPFVSFRVAHTERRINRETGEVTERTDWISCSLDGDGGKLLPYLKRGVKVFVAGDCRMKTFRSTRDGLVYAGMDLFVRTLELCGGPVPNDSEKGGKDETPF